MTTLGTKHQGYQLYNYGFNPPKIDISSLGNLAGSGQQAQKPIDAGKYNSFPTALSLQGSMFAGYTQKVESEIDNLNNWVLKKAFEYKGDMKKFFDSEDAKKYYETRNNLEQQKWNLQYLYTQVERKEKEFSTTYGKMQDLGAANDYAYINGKKVPKGDDPSQGYFTNAEYMDFIDKNSYINPKTSMLENPQLPDLLTLRTNNNKGKPLYKNIFDELAKEASTKYQGYETQGIKEAKGGNLDPWLHYISFTQGMDNNNVEAINRSFQSMLTSLKGDENALLSADQEYNKAIERRDGSVLTPYKLDNNGNIVFQRNRSTGLNEPVINRDASGKVTPSVMGFDTWLQDQAYSSYQYMRTGKYTSKYSIQEMPGHSTENDPRKMNFITYAQLPMHFKADNPDVQREVKKVPDYGKPLANMTVMSSHDPDSRLGRRVGYNINDQVWYTNTINGYAAAQRNRLGITNNNKVNIPGSQQTVVFSVGDVFDFPLTLNQLGSAKIIDVYDEITYGPKYGVKPGRPNGSNFSATPVYIASPNRNDPTAQGQMYNKYRVAIPDDAMEDMKLGDKYNLNVADFALFKGKRKENYSNRTGSDDVANYNNFWGSNAEFLDKNDAKETYGITTSDNSVAGYHIVDIYVPVDMSEPVNNASQLGYGMTNEQAIGQEQTINAQGRANNATQNMRNNTEIFNNYNWRFYQEK